MDRALTLSGIPARLIVDDGIRDAVIAGLANAYASTHLHGLDGFDRETVLHGFRIGCRAGLTLVVAGAESAEAVVRQR